MTSAVREILIRPWRKVARGQARRLRNERGLTMPDVLLAMAVSGLVIVAGFMFYAGVLRSSRGTSGLAGLQRDAAFGIEIMTRDIREGSSVTVAPGSIVGSDSVRIFQQVSGVSTLLESYYLDANGGLVNSSGTTLLPNADSLQVTTVGSMVNLALYLRDPMGSQGRVTDDQKVLMVGTAACRNTQ